MTQTPFLAWWRLNCPTSALGDAFAAYQLSRGAA